jgi:hypothetical protein
MKAMFPTEAQINQTALTFTLGAMGLLLCSSRSHAQQEPNREIKASTVSTNKYRFKFRFNAASPAEAARALEAIRQVCGGK